MNKIFYASALLHNEKIKLYGFGTFEAVQRFVEEDKLKWVDTQQTEDSAPAFR